MLSDALRQPRTELGTNWRRLPVDRQALREVAHLRKGETYADHAHGFAIGTTTVYRYLRERHRRPRRAGTHSGPGDRHRGPQGVRDTRRNPAAHRPGRDGRRPRPPVLLREA